MLVVITVEGGCVQNVECDGNIDVDVMIVDLDNIKAGDDFPDGPNYQAAPLDLTELDQRRKEWDERHEDLADLCSEMDYPEEEELDY
jgi:hypothetical protein